MITFWTGNPSLSKRRRKNPNSRAGRHNPAEGAKIEQMDFVFVEEIRQQRIDSNRQKVIADHVASWGYCWGWTGPEVGQPCEIHTVGTLLADPSPDQFKGSKTIYAYMERCILLDHRNDGTWLAEIAMGEIRGVPWHKDGIRVILEITDIWPPTRDIRWQRKAETHICETYYIS